MAEQSKLTSNLEKMGLQIFVEVRQPHTLIILLERCSAMH
jgi:hypothetical protein